jgi:hypothetical protein
MSALQPGDRHLEGDGLGITPDKLKRAPLAVNAQRPLAIPPRQIKSTVPPSCPRFSEFNAIHSSKGDRNG